MNSVNDFLETVKKRFPRQGDRIEQLYKKDADFRSLCGDYFICLQALKKFKEMTQEGEQSVNDYETAMRELEKELYDFIFP